LSGPISDHIRSNIWAIAACFIAAMGTAVVASASNDGPAATKSASAKKQIKKLKKVVAAQGGRIAVLEGKPAPVTPIGTVPGLDIAASTSPTGGINFAPDTNLYREASSRLRTDDTFFAGTGAIGNLTGATLSSLGIEVASANVNTAFLDTSGNLSMSGDLRLDSGRVTLFEIADPGTPPANQAWLYLRDDAGNSNLVVEFNGDEDVIASSVP